MIVDFFMCNSNLKTFQVLYTYYSLPFLMRRVFLGVHFPNLEGNKDWVVSLNFDFSDAYICWHQRMRNAAL